MLQLVKTFPRHRIRSQSGHLGCAVQGEGPLLLPLPFVAAHTIDEPFSEARSRDTYFSIHGSSLEMFDRIHARFPRQCYLFPSIASLYAELLLLDSSFMNLGHCIPVQWRERERLLSSGIRQMLGRSGWSMNRVKSRICPAQRLG